MGEAPTNFVLKAYLTEDNARTDTTPLQVKTDTAYLTNGEQLQNFNFFTHTKYYFRIESNEPVTEFYIDWDDGQDNDPKGKANFTTIKLTSPQFVGITSHIFTRDKIHYPKIKVKSVSGFWSKYYQASGDHSFVGIDVLQAEASNQLTAGRNDRYKIEADTTTPAESRIPAFAPTPKPPICILKTDKKRVYSGINNALLGAKKGVKEGSNVRLTGGSDKIEEIRTATQVKVTYTTTGLDTGNTGDTGARGDITTSIMTFGAAGSTVATISNVLDILKVELINQLEDSVSAGGSSPANNKLYPGEKMFLTLGSSKPTDIAENFSGGYPCNIAEVSLGNPIVELDDPRYTVTLDATESFARTPEQTIDEYYIDDGKKHLNRGYTESHYYQELGTVNKFTDIFKKSTLSGAIDTNKTNSGLMKRSYTFDVHFDWCDDNYRWLPKQVLARGQVKASTPAVAASPASDSKATYTYSYLEHWQNDSHATNYNTDGAAATYSWPDDMKSSNLLAVLAGIGTNDDWKDASLRNRAASGQLSDAAIFGIHDDTSSNVSGFDSQDSRDFQMGAQAELGSTTSDGIVIAARDKKWTKQYWQRALDFFAFADDTIPMSPRVNPAGTPHGKNTSSATNYGGVGYTGYSYMNMRVQAFYTGLQGDGASATLGGAGAMWKPLKLLNKTKHPEYDDTTWYTSGIFEWEEPEDWVSVDPADIPDKYWPTGDFEGDAAAFSSDVDVETVAAVAQVQRILFTYNAGQGAVNFDSDGTPNEVIAYQAESGTTDVSDGLSVLANNNSGDVVGKYFRFTECKNPSSDQEWYVWFRQNATTHIDSFLVQKADNGTATNRDDFTFVTDSSNKYGKAFVLRKGNGDNIGFWLNFGGDYANDPFGINETNTYVYVPDRQVAVDCTSITLGSGTATNQHTTDVADAIRAAIDGDSDFSAVRSGNFVDITWSGDGAGYDADRKYVDTQFTETLMQSNTIFKRTWSRVKVGKAQGANPSTKESSLNNTYGLEVVYSEGAHQNTIATAVAAAINDKTSPSIGVTAEATGGFVDLTQDTGGAVADVAEGTSSSSTDSLDLRSLIYPVTGSGAPGSAPDPNGADATYGGNFFNGKWDNTYPKYALMFVVEADADPSDQASWSAYGQMMMNHTWPCSNNHSVIIDIVDPMCVSLSAYSIAQSISFTHKGKHQIVTDRLGKADIRKIGADGGAITFGGVDLKDSARKAFYDFQRKATPVYIDVAHTNGEYSRFFGIIISMSESHPQGGMFPKFGLQMQVSHMIQYDASGNMLTKGYISLGGDMDEPTYI